MQNIIYFKAFSNTEMDVVYFDEPYINDDLHTGLIDSLPIDFTQKIMDEYDLSFIIDYSTKPFPSNNKELKKPHTILLENDGLLSTETDLWIKSFDTNFREINPNYKDYDRFQDFYMMNILTDRNLTDIFTSSGFVRNMDCDAAESFGKGIDGKFTQLDYFSHLLKHALRIREINNYDGLTIHINYISEDFLEDVKRERLGRDVKTYLKLIFRQFEGFITLHIYKNYKRSKTINTESDLGF